MKSIIAIIVLMVAMLVGGCVSAYTKPKYPVKATDQRSELTFKVRKGVSYGFQACLLDNEPFPNIDIWHKKESWVPINCRVIISQKHGELLRQDVSFLKPTGEPGHPDWLICVFEAKFTGEVNIVITGNLSFLNKGREWRLCHTILK